MLSAAWPALRQELQLHGVRADRDGSPAWHLCDPVRNLFFRIGWLECEVLRRWRLADAGRIAHDIAASTTLRPTADDVLGVAAFLHAHRLLERHDPPKRGSAWQWLLHHYLSLRLPLVQPASFLRATLPSVRWIFGPVFLGVSLLATLAGLALTARQWDRFAAQAHAALDGNPLGAHGLAVGVALVLTKLLHECAHAWVATAQGLRVGHMGIALLVLAPVPYTDTGESWRLAAPAARLKIALAGILAECLIAGWATLVWALAPDGPVSQGAFFLATSAWLVTLAVNASPFMRYDGYFALADALDLPGLHERAGAQARRIVRRVVAGLDEAAPDALGAGGRRALAVFALMTWLYRLVLFTGIALLVYHAVFKALGLLLFAIEIHVFVLAPVWREVRHWWHARAHAGARHRRFVLPLLALALPALVFVPLDRSVRVDGVFQAEHELELHAPFAARLGAIGVPPAEAMRPVRRGAPVAELQAPLQADERLRAEALSRAWSDVARGALGLASDGAARSALADSTGQRWRTERRAREQELQRLRLDSPVDGHVVDVDPALVPGTWLSPRQPLATAIGGSGWRVAALVPERERGRLRRGEPVRVVLKGRTAVLDGRLESVDDAPVTKLPAAAFATGHGGSVALAPGTPAAQLRPADGWFRVIVRGDSTAGCQCAGPDGTVLAQRAAVVHLPLTARSLGARWGEAIASALLRQANW